MAKAKKAARPKVRVTVLFEPEEYDRLLAYCERGAHKQSTLIAHVVREYLDRKDAEPAEADRRGAQSRTKQAPRRKKAVTKPTRTRR